MVSPRCSDWCATMTTMDTAPPEDRIVLRQSWLNTLAMCPEWARQIWTGAVTETDSSSTVLGTAVHYAIEQTLREQLETGTPLSENDTIHAGMSYWVDHLPDIERWNHKAQEPPETIRRNIAAWYTEVLPDLRPIAVEYSFEIPLVVDHQPEIWLRGTVDLVQEFPLPIVDWKNPSRKPHNEWEKKRWSVQAAAYTWAVATEHGLSEPLPFEFVHLVKGEVHRTIVDCGPAEWATLVALARSAGTLITANLPVWPLRMDGWHCSPKWCAAWSSCRGRFAGLDPWKQL